MAARLGAPCSGREIQSYSSPLPRIALDTHRAAVQFRQLAANRQTEPAALLLDDLPVELKIRAHALDLFRRETATLVQHLDLKLLFRTNRSHGYGTARLRELKSILEQLAHN